MFIFVRAIVWAMLFVSFLLVYVPRLILSAARIAKPEGFGALQITGMILVAFGVLITLSCLLAFVFIGKGTAAPFDPPRRLVVRGPYSYVRNPMYIGAGTAMIGAALYYGSWQLIAYLFVQTLIVHNLVVHYEEPTLRRTFGQEYDTYRARTGRWLPRLR